MKKLLVRLNQRNGKMKRLPGIWCLLRHSLAAGSLAAGVGLTSNAMAQTSEVAAGSDKEDSAVLEEIFVTGSRIRQKNLVSVSPVADVQADAFEERGAVRVEQLLNKLPQFTPAQNLSSGGNVPAGTSQANLRGLGADRTLVLVNGKRLPFGSPTAPPADINQVPLILLKNVEVLSGGASAIYGSDALAGVVNFILDDNFEGMRFRTNQSIYQHTNDNSQIQGIARQWEALNPGQYPLPDKNVWDGYQQEYSIAIGANFNEGRSNAAAYATYSKIDGVKWAERDYTACLLAAALPGGNTYTCRPSPVGLPASFVNTGAVGLPAAWRVFDNQFVLRNSAVDSFNDAQYTAFQRPDEQYTLGGRAHHEINEHLIPYVNASFHSTETVGDGSPGGILNTGIIPNVGALNCDNAFFSAQQADFLCTSRGLSIGSNYDPVTGVYLGPDDIADGFVLNRRALENGTRNQKSNLRSYRIEAGLRGALAGPFEYDLSVIQANSQITINSDVGVDNWRTANALNAVIDRRVNPDGTPFNPATFGQPACAVNVDATPVNDAPDCAPLDYFSTNGPSPEAVAYIDHSGLTEGHTGLTDILLVINGDLGSYGIKSPFADSAVGVALGGEYRKNTLTLEADRETRIQGFGAKDVNGQTSVNELFGEINVPIVDGKPFAQVLSFEAAYRYSDYEGRGSTDTYKLGLNWAPIDAVRLRGSFQHAVRAPNVSELFSAQKRGVVLQLTQNPNGYYDPCAGPTPWATLAQCANTGVEAADYGNIADNTFAGQLEGGNPNLGEESADTHTFGVVLTPSFIPNFTATIDRWDIQVDDLIGTISASIILPECLNTGNPFFCDLIHRGDGGTLFATSDSYISLLNVNTGSLKTSGWDVSLNYSVNLPPLFGGKAGSLNFNLAGTYLDEYTTKPLPTSTPAQTYDCAGYVGFACGLPKSVWRHHLRAGWDTPMSGLWVGLTWRYYSAVDISTKSSQPALSGAYFPVQDLAAASLWDLSSTWTMVDGLTIRAGINNLLDEEPPLNVGTGPGAGGFYDTLGRNFFVGVTLDIGR